METQENIDNWLWVEHQEVESTNDEAINFSKTASKGSKFVITTVKQTSGRGRRGRHWESIEGNLFMSFGIELKIHKLGQLIFVVGLSLAQTIHNLQSSANVLLKWPNDVLLNDKKVSGILLEKGEGEFMIIGVGVNIVDSPKIDGLIYPATSLKEADIQTDRVEFLKLYLKNLDKNLDTWEKHSFQPIKSAWINLAKNLGGKIKVQQEDGATIGKFIGVDDNGLLLMDVNGITERIYAGDVHYV